MKRINEIFYSIQGEGFHTGTPAIFVRFAGCNLKCSFCDTFHDPYIEMSDDEILDEVCRYPAKMVVLTGGEPGLQVTNELVKMLKDAGKYVCIETNGTVSVPDNIDWVTCSPKGNYDIIPFYDELKIVYLYQKQDLSIYNNNQIENMYLQPCSGKNTAEVIQYIKQHPHWKLSLQTHKMIGIE